MRFIISIEHQDFYLIFVTNNYIVSTQMNASILIFSMSLCKMYTDTMQGEKGGRKKKKKKKKEEKRRRKPSAVVSEPDKVKRKRYYILNRIKSSLLGWFVY